jgi:hypothetical protein
VSDFRSGREDLASRIDHTLPCAHATAASVRDLPDEPDRMPTCSGIAVVVGGPA